MLDSQQTMTMRDGAAIEIYRAPAIGKRRGALILIQEIFGLTDHIREQCDRFAAQGYEVWAPAIFDREAPGMRLSYSPEDVAAALAVLRRHDFDQAVGDVAECVAALAPNGPVCVTGYCYGGSIAWATACRVPGLAAAACYYGARIPSLAHEQPRCPVLLHFGVHDHEIPRERVEEVRARHPEVAVALYEAGHGFNSDRRADYDSRSAQQAWDRTLAWFYAAA